VASAELIQTFQSAERLWRSYLLAEGMEKIRS